MKKTVAFLLFIAIAMTGFAQVGKVKTDIVGKWKFQASGVPYEYSAGTITVSLKEKAYFAKVTFWESDYELNLEKITYENNILKASSYIDGSDVTVSMKVKDAKTMEGKGTVDYESFTIKAAKMEQVLKNGKK